MKLYIRKNIFIFLILLVLSAIIFYFFWWVGLIIILIFFGLIELYLQWTVPKVRSSFQWMITDKLDRFPEIDREGLRKFMENGFDPWLGWVRKPNTSHPENGKFSQTKWHINDIGSRLNPGFENFDRKIACFGDSFTFSRQVNDNETWEFFLSEYTASNVINWGIGNHGIDQAYLRMQREYSKHPVPLVIIGVVPDTISRILSRWKHFYEYGNTFAFKPQFVLKNKSIELLPNIIDSEEKFLHYKKYYIEIANTDFFFDRKFNDEIFSFPYTFSFIRNIRRNSSIIWNISKYNKNYNIAFFNKAFMTIMNVNLKWRLKLFKNTYAVNLLKSIIEKCVAYSRDKNFKLVVVFLPQKDDVLYTKQKGHFYNQFIRQLSEKNVVFDIMPHLINIGNIDDYYSDNNDYGGHYSALGNKYVAGKINEYINQNKLI